MKTRLLIPALAGAMAIALPLGALTVSAQVPEPPSRFAGAVTVGGTPAASGTQVEARIGSTTCGTTTTTTVGGEARYVLDSPAASQSTGCGSDGAAVTFFVGGVQAGTGTWHNYQLNTVNLSTTQATPTATQPPATATATRTTVPTAPETGSGLAEGNEGGAPLMLLLGGAVALATGVGAAGVTAVRRRR